MRPKSAIVQLPIYQPGKPIEDVKREFGLSEIIKLASNENTYGCSPSVKQSLIDEMDHLSLYPDSFATELSETVAAHIGVKTNQLVFGVGSDEVILMIARAFLTPGDETIMADQTFPQYKHNVTIEGGAAIEVPLKEGTHDLDAMLAQVTERTKIIWVCNPNNPTGTIVNHQALKHFIQQIPKHVLVVLDEAYYEYVVDSSFPDSLVLLNTFDNVIFLRTFSKIYGLASLRIGYGVGQASVIQLINQVREPFNTSYFAQRAALNAIKDQTFVTSCRIKNREGLAQLQQVFDKLGLSYFETQGNFVMVDVLQEATLIFEKLLRFGMITRAGFQRYPTHLRVTIGSRHQNERFTTLLAKVLKEDSDI